MKKRTDQKNGTPQIRVDENKSLEEQVTQRAHELWLLRGGAHGGDQEDWFQAEREIIEWRQKQRQGKPSSGPGL